MGEVYRATDQRLGRDVALKFLSAGASTGLLAVERLEREARAVSALNHRRICTLHDIGEYEGRPFLVMELLDGVPLKEPSRRAMLTFANIFLLAGFFAKKPSLTLAPENEAAKVSILG